MSDDDLIKAAENGSSDRGAAAGTSMQIINSKLKEAKARRYNLLRRYPVRSHSSIYFLELWCKCRRKCSVGHFIYTTSSPVVTFFIFIKRKLRQSCQPSKVPCDQNEDEKGCCDLFSSRRDELNFPLSILCRCFCTTAIRLERITWFLLSMTAWSGEQVSWG